MSLFNSIDIYIEKFITILFIYYNFFIHKLKDNFNFNKNQQIENENEILFDNKTQKKIINNQIKAYNENDDIDNKSNKRLQQMVSMDKEINIQDDKKELKKIKKSTIPKKKCTINNDNLLYIILLILFLFHKK